MTRIAPWASTALITSLLALFNPAQARNPGTPPMPVVDSVHINTSSQQIAVAGKNFGPQPPVVYLAGQRLEVMQVSARQMVLKMPVGLTPATYRLSINPARSHGAESSMYLQVP